MRDFCVGVGLWNQWGLSFCLGRAWAVGTRRVNSSSTTLRWSCGVRNSSSASLRWSFGTNNSNSVIFRWSSGTTNSSSSTFRWSSGTTNSNSASLRWSSGETNSSSAGADEVSHFICSTQPDKLNNLAYFVQLNPTNWTTPPTLFNSTLQAEQHRQTIPNKQAYKSHTTPFNHNYSPHFNAKKPGEVTFLQTFALF